MIMAPGLCCKCGRHIAGSPYYNHVEVKMQGRIPEGMTEDALENRPVHLMDVAICSECDLLDDDFKPLMDSLNDYFKANGGKEIECDIIEVVQRKTLPQLLAQSQGGKCVGCHEPIGGNWVLSGKYVLHEGCSLPPPMPMINRAKGQVRAVR